MPWKEGKKKRLKEEERKKDTENRAALLRRQPVRSFLLNDPRTLDERAALRDYAGVSRRTDEV